MFNRKKNVRRLIAFGLGLMMMLSTGIVAYASKENSIVFEFDLPAGGEKLSSDPVPKYNNNPTARIDFKTYENNSQNPIWYRLRDGESDAAATDLYSVIGTGVQYPNYLSGYGQYFSGYYIRIQTDSLSTGGAKVGGYFEP